MKLLFLVEKFSNEIFPICRLLNIVYRVFSLSKACKPFGTITLAQLLLKFDKFISSIFIFIFFNIMNRGTALNPFRLSIFQSPECRSFFFGLRLIPCKIDKKTNWILAGSSIKQKMHFSFLAVAWPCIVPCKKPFHSPHLLPPTALHVQDKWGWYWS